MLLKCISDCNLDPWLEIFFCITNLSIHVNVIVFRSFMNSWSNGMVSFFKHLVFRNLEHYGILIKFRNVMLWSGQTNIKPLDFVSSQNRTTKIHVTLKYETNGHNSSISTTNVWFCGTPCHNEWLWRGLESKWRRKSKIYKIFWKTPYLEGQLKYKITPKWRPNWHFTRRCCGSLLIEMGGCSTSSQE